MSRATTSLDTKQVSIDAIMNHLYLAFTYYSKEKRKVDFRIDRDKKRDERRRNPKHFSSEMFYENSRMRTRKESCSLAKMLSLLPAPKHYFTSLSTVEKGTCKQRISAPFLGTRTVFIRAVPKIFS